MKESDFAEYLERLLIGDHRGCSLIVQRLLSQDIPIKDIYGLFQRSLYLVGDLWEHSQISVATEHLATSITGSMMTLVYPKLFASPRSGRRAVVACVGGEFHEIGAKMVADTFELHGWDSYFLGANTPVDDLITLVGEKNSEVLGLSVSINRNMELLEEIVGTALAAHPQLKILAGGQAVRHSGLDLTSDSRLICLRSLGDLETWIASQ